MSFDKQTLENLRQEYKAAKLSEKDVAPDPISQFSNWFSQALDSGLYEPNVMTLATVSPDGKPSVRVMLLKGFEEKGFIFYTNYLSRKGKELSRNPAAAIVVFWAELERQVRVEGVVEKVSKEDSIRYFHSRPKASQIGALASPQSQEIPNRGVLIQNMEDLHEKYKDQAEIPKPSHWGGYILKPQIVEFWQGGESRLHDRIVYKKTNKNNWKIIRLAP